MPGPQGDRKPLVTLRKTTDGRISCSLPLLVGGTRRSARKRKNLPRHALIWRCNSRPAGWAAGTPSRASLRLGGVGDERAVLQAGSSLADADGPTQMVADLRRHHAVAAVDG